MKTGQNIPGANSSGIITSLELLTVVLGAQEDVCRLCCQGTLLAHVQLAFPQVLSAELLSSQSDPCLYCCLGLFCQVQGFKFIVLKSHAILVGPIFQPEYY